MKTGAIILIIFSFVILLGILIYIILSEKYYSRVKKTSERYKNVLKLNGNFIFHSFEDMKYHRKLKSKAQFDRFNFQNFLLGMVEDGFTLFESIIEKIDNNVDEQKKYNEEYYGLKSSMTKDETKK